MQKVPICYLLLFRPHFRLNLKNKQVYTSLSSILRNHSLQYKVNCQRCIINTPSHGSAENIKVPLQMLPQKLPYIL